MLKDFLYLFGLLLLFAAAGAVFATRGVDRRPPRR